jgi:RNA polymerase sigma-70 factor, ECF subfamily
MTISPTLSFAPLCAQAYAEGFAFHGDLNLDAATFGHRLQQILDQQLNSTADSEAGIRLLAKLHKNDLYLTCACVLPAEAAWCRFLLLYRRYVSDLACLTCSSVDIGLEAADFVLTELCLPDRQGRSRISSYDGRVPLVVWLRAIVVHHAYRERQRKCHQFARLNDLPDFADPLSGIRLEASLRDHAYRDVIITALREAIDQLSQRERLMLRLRYEEGLRGEEVARLLKLSPSTISRGLQAAQAKLKEVVVTFLMVKLNGQSAEIDECLADLLENPIYSLLTMLGEAPSL